MKKKKLLTISEAMDYLNVSRITLQRWDNNGKLKAIRTKGGHRRYKLSDLEKYIDEEPNEFNYGTLYECLCTSLLQANELNKEGSLEKDICDDLSVILTKVGDKLLHQHLENAMRK